MTIGEDIVKWAATRPIWQQRVLQILAEGRSVTDAEVAALVDELLETPDDEGHPTPLDLAMPPADDAQISLVAVRDCKGVNALVDGEDLAFAKTGLNIIYGDNGSGKSGYARLIKGMVGARHPTEILADVFEESPASPSALLCYAEDDKEEQQKHPGPPSASVKKMSFYDEHCGDVYLNTKSVLTYRPSALVVLEGLIMVCDRMRDELQSRLSENLRTALNLGLPPDTTAGQFLESLTAQTTDAQIVAATKADTDAATKRAAAASEVARLETSDSTREKTRLQGLASAANSLTKHLQNIASELDTGALANAAQELQVARTARQAAEIAATDAFNEALPVGGETWRALWLAARSYSVAEAYHDQDFPVTHDGAYCPLCQQPLSDQAADRLRRFNRFVTDTTQAEAVRAEAVVAARTSLPLSRDRSRHGVQMHGSACPVRETWA
jgi:energy-coupling factor transporter ATP-binding protein EcfA2